MCGCVRRASATTGCRRASRSCRSDRRESRRPLHNCTPSSLTSATSSVAPFNLAFFFFGDGGGVGGGSCERLGAAANAGGRRALGPEDCGARSRDRRAILALDPARPADRQSLVLERQVKALQERQSSIELLDEEQGESSENAMLVAGSRPRSRASRALLANMDGNVGRAVSVLDRMGALTSVLLRRNPWVRVGFGLYVLLIHLWVLFILVHLVNEREGAGIDGAGGGASSDSVDIAATLMTRSRGLGNG